MNVQTEIERATVFGHKIEDLVVRKGQCPTGDRETLLIAYWSLIFDFHKGILALLTSEHFGSALALVRPVMEVLVRSHLALIGSDDEVRQLQGDTYRVNFKEIGTRIDAAFQLNGLIQRVLDEASRTALHSYTHGGIMQLGRRFDGHNLKPNYSEGLIFEVIHSTTSAAWMVNNLATKHFKFEDEWKVANELFAEWGKQ